MRRTISMMVLLLSGCGVSVTPNPDPVDFKGTLTLNGEPANDLKLNFQPVETGLPAVVPVKDGAFEAKITPGKYTWYVTQGANEKTLEAVSTEFQEGSMARIIDIQPGMELKFVMD